MVNYEEIFAGFLEFIVLHNPAVEMFQLGAPSARSKDLHVFLDFAMTCYNEIHKTPFFMGSFDIE